MESVYDGKSNCSGCAACYEVCPVGAIEMVPDEEGFQYPRIDQDLCVDCRACQEACPVRRPDDFKSAGVPQFYVAKHKSAKVLKVSTSGGAFTALSDVVLGLGGSIYGADFDDELRVVHTRAETPEQRDSMRISKYVQSQLSPIYDLLSADLDSGKAAFFTGTPCQTAAIRSCFQDHPGNDGLYICDLICHSVPSPRVWDDYKKMLAEEAGGRLVKIQFRSKQYAWSRENSNKGLMYLIEGEEDFREDDRYYQLFIQDNVISRPSCYTCKFTDVRRASDITIADYFGIEEFEPKLYDPLGVSLILANTAKGKNLLELSADKLHLEERPGTEALTHQKRLSSPGDEPHSRKEFWADYLKNGLKACFISPGGNS
ncbi:4Fe-4S ferredoxin [Deltaproteobacteria bacterium Smac51]|nr:4Fe-4S ferredoxin [Deltaproteobacteria bacterium Smac51]